MSSGKEISTEKEITTGKDISTRNEISAGNTAREKVVACRAYTFLTLLTMCLVALFTVSTWKSVTELDAQRKLNCQSIKGNSDMYGLGIRVGVYTQLAVSAFVDSFGDQEYSAGLIPSTLCFLFALSVALSMALYDPNTNSSEVYIIISLGNAVTAVMLSKIAKFNPLKSNESYLLSYGRLLLWGVWRASTSVYWWTLIHENYVDGSATCGTWGWIFFKVDLHGPFRTLNEAINVLEWIALGYFLLAYLIGTILFCYCLSRMKIAVFVPSKFVIAFDYLFVSIGTLRQIMYGVTDTGEPQHLSSTTAKGDAESGSANRYNSFEDRLREHIKAHYTRQEFGIDQVQECTEPINKTTATGKAIPTYAILRFYWKYRDSIRTFLRGIGFQQIKIPLLLLWDISTIAYTVLNVEFSLRLNSIDGIYEIWSAGQLFPAIIGVGGIGVAACELYVYRREKTLKVNWAKSVDITRIEHAVAWNSEPDQTQTSSGVTDNKTKANFKEASQEKLEPTSVDITPVRAHTIQS